MRERARQPEPAADCPEGAASADRLSFGIGQPDVARRHVPYGGGSRHPTATPLWGVGHFDTDSGCGHHSPGDAGSCLPSASILPHARRTTLILPTRAPRIMPGRGGEMLLDRTVFGLKIRCRGDILQNRCKISAISGSKYIVSI